MYEEDELLPISALQHLAFCERQWALIHLEGVWQENRLTAEGSHLHDRVHDPETEVRGALRIARGLRLRSLRLGLTGKADVVEFHRVLENTEPAGGVSPQPSGVRLEGVPGLWHPVPVEYKRGRPKVDRCDEVQLCAQAVCLEEMLGISIASGALFYGKPRRRYEVSLDAALRQETESLAARLHHLTQVGETPAAYCTKSCRNCSLLDICLPKAARSRSSVHRYLSQAIAEAGADAP